MFRKWIAIGLFSGIATFSVAQEPIVQQRVEELLESVGENLNDETDIQEILEDLEGYRMNPLQINFATTEDLGRLHLISELQIHNLISYREKTGQIFSIFEMASIDGFTPDILQKIEPFISFETADNFAGRKKSSGYLFLKSSRTFSNQTEQANYEGSPERYYLRMKQTSAKFEYGLVAEKDPGEAFFSQSNKQGFDYTSVFANFRVGKARNRIFAGDYHVSFGQGLMAWQGFSMGKSAETTMVIRSDQGIRSYSSTDENQFFRGLAGQFNIHHFTFSPFVSCHRLDANTDTLEGQTYFGAFQTSGYHRFGSELSGENSITQLVGGAHLSYAYKQWIFGMTTVYTHFDIPMNRSDELYNQFLPEGKESVVGGIDWKGSVRNIFFFGEAAICANSGKALLSGLMMKPASNAELALVYRNINLTYFSYFSNAFTESPRVNDEKALYLGIKVFPASNWILNGYLDFFKFKWIKYLTAAPSDGTEFLAQLSFNPSKVSNLYLRFFQEEKEQRIISEKMKYDDQQLINRVRFNFEHNMGKQISLNSRIEYSYYSKQNIEKGYLVCQDVLFKPTEKSFEMNGRLAFFCTDGYNSRLYAYENDVLYSSSIPALFGKGLRAYFNFQHNFGSKFSVWLKLALTHQFAHWTDDVTTQASTKSEIKIQISYQF